MRFSEAQKKHAARVRELLSTLCSPHSDLSTVLSDDFDVGLGNRMERQARAFLPVVVEAGGTWAEGLDHLLATRIFRSGKVTKRYDTTKDHVDAITEALHSGWNRMNLETPPSICERLLFDESRRKERGV